MKGRKSDDNEYQHKEHETVSRWDEEMLLNVVPETEESARKYLAGCNIEDTSKKLKEHFAGHIRRLSE